MVGGAKHPEERSRWAFSLWCVMVTCRTPWKMVLEGGEGVALNAGGGVQCSKMPWREGSQSILYSQAAHNSL